MSKPEMKMEQVAPSSPRTHAEISADIDAACAMKIEGEAEVYEAKESIKRLTAEMKAALRGATGRKSRVKK